MTCILSAILPRAKDDSAAADKGTEKHGLLEEADFHGGPPAWWAHGLDGWDRLRREIPASLWSPDTSEVAFRYSTAADVAEEVGRRRGRHYGVVGSQEIVGTADRAAPVDDEDRVVVLDWKTGQGWVTPAAENWQLKILALMAARAWGADEARVYLAFIREGRPPYVDSAYFSAFDLALIAEDVRTATEKIRATRAQVASGAFPVMRRGKHCTYCPSFDFCPAWHNLIWSLLTQGERAAMAQAIHAGLDDQAGVRPAYERWRELHTLDKVLGSRIAAVAARHPISLGEGLEYGPVNSAERVRDHDKARAILAEVVGADLANAASSEWKTSKTAIERALTEHAKKIDVPVGQLVARTMERLRAEGAFGRTQEIREHKTKE